MGKIRSPNIAGAGRLAPPLAAAPDPATQKVVFGFQHIVEAYSLGGCKADDASAFLDALRLRCSLTWAQVSQAPRQGLGSEKISAALNVAIPDSIPKDRHDDMRSFRFGGNKQRFIGFRSGATFEVVWVDHDGNCYDHG